MTSQFRSSESAETGDRYHHGNLKVALIAAGLELLREKGIGGLSLRACAARAGVSHAAPKNHFGSLEGLLSAIAAEGFAQFNEAQRMASIDGGEGVNRLDQSIRSYVQFARDHPDLFRLMWDGSRCDFEDDRLSTEACHAREMLGALVRSTGMVPEGHPEIERKAQLMIWCLAHGMAHLSLEGMITDEMSDPNEMLRLSDLAPFFCPDEG